MPESTETTTTTGETGTETSTTAPESSSAPEGAEQNFMESLPPAAQEYVRQLRTEAARYRSERNQIRDEATTLRTRVDTHDRQRVEAIASERLHDARDLLDRLKDLDELRGEDGLLNEDAVGQRIDALVSERPHLAKQPKPTSWGQGARGTRTDAPPSFGAALKDRHRT